MEFKHSEIIMLLFTAIGPLKVTIVCASLTAGASPDFVKRVAWRSVLIASIVCLVFAVLGEAILRLMKVSIPAFQIGGGIIVLLFSLDMVMGSKSATQEGPESSHKRDDLSLDIAVYPLAIPLMASVSGLVAIVSLLAQRDDLESLLFMAGVIVAIMALNYFCLVYCRYIVAAVGPAVLQVVSKMLGVILTALAVELLLMGLIGLGLIAKPGGTSSPSASSTDTRTTNTISFAGQPMFCTEVNPIGEEVLELPIKGMGTSCSDHEARGMRSTCSTKVFACQHRGIDLPANSLPHTWLTMRETDASSVLV